MEYIMKKEKPITKPIKKATQLKTAPASKKSAPQKEANPPKAVHIKPKPKKSKETNAWRKQPGVDNPLKIGRGIRTRDEFFEGQKDKNIHSEIPKEELYRRGAVVDINNDKNLMVIKTRRAESKRTAVSIPEDKQKRRYEQKLLTIDENGNYIKLNKGHFELAPKEEDLTYKQAREIKRACVNKSKKNIKANINFQQNKKPQGPHK